MSKNYSNRWKKDIISSTALKNIMQLIKNGGDFNAKNSPFDLINNEYIDFRGLQLDKIKINNVSFMNSDLSNTNFKSSWIEHSTFNKVIFEKVDFSQFSDHGNRFINCKFLNCKFIGAAIGYDGSKFDNSFFLDCDFGKALFIRGEFSNSIFKDCKFNGLDFNASSFEKCIFSGKLINVWFRGGYALVSDINVFGQAKKNEMKNVSFENADLIDVTFSNECNLSSIKAPKNNKYYVFDNWNQRLLNLKNSVVNWPDNQKKEAEIFTKSYLVHSKTQDWYIINSDDLIRYYGVELATKIIFKLLK